MTITKLGEVCLKPNVEGGDQLGFWMPSIWHGGSRPGKALGRIG